MPVNKDVVAGFGIGVGGHIGNAASGLRHHGSLPLGSRKHVAVSPTGGAAVGDIVPYRFALDGSIRRDQARPSSSENMRRRSREVHMVLTIGHSIATTIVAASRNDCDAEQSSFMRHLIEVLDGLLGS